MNTRSIRTLHHIGFNCVSVDFYRIIKAIFSIQFTHGYLIVLANNNTFHTVLQGGSGGNQVVGTRHAGRIVVAVAVIVPVVAIVVTAFVGRLIFGGEEIDENTLFIVIGTHTGTDAALSGFQIVQCVPTVTIAAPAPVEMEVVVGAVTVANKSVAASIRIVVRTRVI